MSCTSNRDHDYAETIVGLGDLVGVSQPGYVNGILCQEGGSEDTAFDQDLLSMFDRLQAQLLMVQRRCGRFVESSVPSIPPQL